MIVHVSDDLAHAGSETGKVGAGIPGRTLDPVDYSVL